MKCVPGADCAASTETRRNCSASNRWCVISSIFQKCTLATANLHRVQKILARSGTAPAQSTFCSDDDGLTFRPPTTGLPHAPPALTKLISVVQRNVPHPGARLRLAAAPAHTTHETKGDRVVISSDRTFSFSLSRAALLSAVALVAAAAVVLGLSWWLIGPNTAQAAYLAIMFLLSPAKALPIRLRLLAAAWAVAVAISGYLVGPLGLGPVLLGLVVVSFMQALFRLGPVASVNRSPVNFVVFASLGAVASSTSAGLGLVALGSVIGAGFVLALSTLLPAHTTTAPSPAPSPLRDRMEYGVLLGLGSALIVVVSSWLGFPFAEWTLISFCMILSVGIDGRLTRARDRVLGTVAGALLGTLVSLLPTPIPLIAGVLATVLCVAYLNLGNYTLFIAFLTPAILLTTSSEQSAVALGWGRITAVLLASVLALGLSFAAEWLPRVHRGKPGSQLSA